MASLCTTIALPHFRADALFGVLRPRPLLIIPQLLQPFAAYFRHRAMAESAVAFHTFISAWRMVRFIVI